MLWYIHSNYYVQVSAVSYIINCLHHVDQKYIIWFPVELTYPSKHLDIGSLHVIKCKYFLCFPFKCCIFPLVPLVFALFYITMTQWFYCNYFGQTTSNSITLYLLQSFSINFPCLVMCKCVLFITVEIDTCHTENDPTQWFGTDHSIDMHNTKALM